MPKRKGPDLAVTARKLREAADMLEAARVPLSLPVLLSRVRRRPMASRVAKMRGAIERYHNLCVRINKAEERLAVVKAAGKKLEEEARRAAIEEARAIARDEVAAMREEAQNALAAARAHVSRLVAIRAHLGPSIDDAAERANRVARMVDSGMLSPNQAVPEIRYIANMLADVRGRLAADPSILEAQSVWHAIRGC